MDKSKKEWEKECSIAKKLLDKCKNEGESGSDKQWTFEFEDIKVQAVSVFAVQEYITSQNLQNKTFRDWLLEQHWIKEIST